MSILSDKSILKLAEGENPLFGDQFNKEKLRGSSYDLRVGTVFNKNGNSKDKLYSYQNEKHDVVYEVAPSQIVMMLTQEEVYIPKNLCGTVYARNQESSKGFLILNPGHIDPGFSGPISICAINLSNVVKYITLGESMFTLLLHELDNETSQPYRGVIFNRPDNKEYNRKEYEIKKFKENASLLSPGIFDLMTLTDYEPYLKKIIWEVMKPIRDKYLKMIITFISVIAAISVIYNIWGSDIFPNKETNAPVDVKKIESVPSILDNEVKEKIDSKNDENNELKENNVDKKIDPTPANNKN
ncbi:MAG: hypothetical protein HKN39_06775 [Flavobacteriales bacterium]|nr:hypothetical protein [Flavobacteriales bacterium]